MTAFQSWYTLTDPAPWGALGWISLRIINPHNYYHNYYHYYCMTQIWCKVFIRYFSVISDIILSQESKSTASVINVYRKVIYYIFFCFFSHFVILHVIHAGCQELYIVKFRNSIHGAWPCCWFPLISNSTVNHGSLIFIYRYHMCHCSRMIVVLG